MALDSGQPTNIRIYQEKKELTDKERERKKTATTVMMTKKSRAGTHDTSATATTYHSFANKSYNLIAH